MRALPMAVWLLAILAGVGTAPAFVAWKLEREVEPPSYAVIEPESSNLNIDVQTLKLINRIDNRRFFRGFRSRSMSVF